MTPVLIGATLRDTLTATTPKPRTRFGHQLREVLERQNVSTRELARRMHRTRPLKWNSPDSARRSVARWVAGGTANGENRAEVAEALGLAPDHFGAAEDEEEEAELFASLADALVSIVRKEVRRLA